MKNIFRGGRRMNKTALSNIEISMRLLVTTNELKALLGCGRASAVKVGDDAGARVTIGKRVLWNCKKVERYLEQIAL